MKKNKLKTLVCGSAAGLAGTACAASGSPGGSAGTMPPNIVLIVVDDLGWNDVEYLPDVHANFESPNIQELASRGMVFSDAYAACPVCSPTRAALMTGKSPAALKLTAHIPMNSGYTAKCIPEDAEVLPPDSKDQLPLEEVTFAEILKTRGYRTGYFGKWHLSGIDALIRMEKEGAVAPQYHPDRQGFDINIGGCAYGLPPSYFSPYTNATLQDGLTGEYLTDRLTEEAIDFIQSSDTSPFLVSLCYYSVHVPFQAKPELVEKYADRGELAAYAAMIASVDENVGRLMNALDAAGLAEETLVVLTSDNGGLMGNKPLRGNKGEMWEGGIRVPLIARWDGRVEPASISREPVITQDLFTTMLDAAGVKGAVSDRVEGESFLSCLTGEHSWSRKTPVYWHYPHYHHAGGPMASAIRIGAYKLIYDFRSGDSLLFNLEKDLGETNDLSDAMPEKVKEMRQKLFLQLERVGARMPKAVSAGSERQML